MPKSTTDFLPSKKPSKEIVRATFRFHGPELKQIREVQEMLSLNTEIDAARYLMQRGLEALTPVLSSRRSQAQMASVVNPQQIFETLLKNGYELDPEAIRRAIEEKK